jgi:hypothetical protein
MKRCLPTPSPLAGAACLGLVLLCLMSFWATGAWACLASPDQAAFAWRLAEDADPQPSGLMLMAYREGESGTVTHVTFHHVIRVLPGKQPDLPEEEAVRFTILFTDGTLGPLTYIISREPLYYGTDLDVNGLPLRLWIDPEEDGLNGNERLVVSRGEIVDP